jgi:hypothetical protein
MFFVGTSNPETGGVGDWAKTVLDGQGKGMGTDPALKARLAQLPKGHNTALYVDLARVRA